MEITRARDTLHALFFFDEESDPSGGDQSSWKLRAREFSSRHVQERKDPRILGIFESPFDLKILEWMIDSRISIFLYLQNFLKGDIRARGQKIGNS